MAEQIKIAELQINATQLISELKITKSEIDRLKAAQKELSSTGQESTSQFIKNEAALKTAQTTYRAQQKTLQQVTGATQELDNEMKKEVKTLAEAEANNKALRQARANLNVTTEQGKKALEEINKKIDQNTDFMKENQDAQVQQKMNIGAYKDSILDALGVQGAYTKGTEILTQAQTALSFVVGKSTGAMKIFRIALASTGVGLLVLALGSLITYLTTTQEGINKVNRVLTPLKEIFQSLKGVAQQLGKALVDTFSSPKKAMEDLSNFVQNNIMNRFKAFGVILKAIQERDWGKLTDGLLQGATGVENLTSKAEKFGKSTSKFFGDAVARGKEIQALTEQLSSGAAAYNEELGKLTKEFKQQNEIAENAALSDKQREKAAQESIETQHKIRKLKEDRINQEIKLMELQQMANDTSDEEAAQLADLKKQRDEFYASESEAVATQQTKVNSIRKTAQTEAARARQEALNAEVAAMEQEVALFQEQKRLEQETLEQQLTVLQQVNDKELAILDKKLKNKLISETEYQTEKLRLENDVRAKQKEIADRDAELEVERQEKLKEIQKTYSDAAMEEAKFTEEQKVEKFYEELEAEIERLATSEAEKHELLKNIKIAQQEEIAELEKNARDKKLVEEQKLFDQEQALEKAKLQSKMRMVDTIGSLFGEETAIAKIALVAKAAMAMKEFIIDNTLFKSKQAKAVGEVAVNTAEGISENAAAAPFPANIPLIAGFVAQVAGLFGAIKSVTIPKPKFARGGVLSGASHAQGGIQTPYGELEGGEAVINKRSTAMYGPLLSSINEAGGGVKFANGGVLGSAGVNNKQLIDYDLLASKMAEANMSLPAPQVAVSEIKNTQSRVEVIESRARF